MADAVSSTYLVKGTRRNAIKLTNISDGTGESAVVKIDASTLTGPDGTAPSAIVIERIEGMVQGFSSVHLLFDATTDDEAAVLGAGYTYFDWTDVGGLKDPQSTGTTGDLVLTTVGASATATYDITIWFRLKD
jgi:hypothetical protein